MSNIKIIKSTDEAWKEYVDASFVYDFYHTLSYNKLEKEGASILFVYSEGNNFIALPLIIRKIPDTNVFDCTSVYGYAGAISNFDMDAISKEFRTSFQNKLNEFFIERKIVSVFSRLHPIIENDILIEGLGEIVSLNKTIAIDLTISSEEQRRQYRKSNKYEINKLKRNNFEVVEAITEEEQNDFINIYYETMKKVDANDDYFFSKDYFCEFLNNNCFETKLLLAKKDGEIAAGAIFTITNKIIQYHLAGTKQIFARDAPMKLILDEARLLGNDLDAKFLHLGGGVGGSYEDPLFRFKSGFSKKTFQFKIWKHIVNKEKYDELVFEKGISNDSSFFPLYRG